MELKDFIKTTIQSIIDATSELIEDNRLNGAQINPALVGTTDLNVVRYSDAQVPVTEISFDVAITEGATKTGGGGARVDVLFAKIGADGNAAASNENVSRVQFSVRAGLPATHPPVDGWSVEDYMRPMK